MQFLAFPYKVLSYSTRKAYSSRATVLVQNHAHGRQASPYQVVLATPQDDQVNPYTSVAPFPFGADFHLGKWIHFLPSVSRCELHSSFRMGEIEYLLPSIFRAVYEYDDETRENFANIENTQMVRTMAAAMGAEKTIWA